MIIDSIAVDHLAEYLAKDVYRHNFIPKDHWPENEQDDHEAPFTMPNNVKTYVMTKANETGATHVRVEVVCRDGEYSVGVTPHE